MTQPAGWSPKSVAEARAAVQMAAGATLALFLATAFRLPHAYWSVISAIVVIQASSASGVFGVARDRAAGTIAGALVGAIAAATRPDGILGLALAIAISTAVLAYFGAKRPAFKIAPVTAAIVIAGSAGPDGTASLALDRVMEIVVGSAVGVGAILLLFPRHARAAFRVEARAVAGDAADLLAAIVTPSTAGEEEVVRRHGDFRRRLDALAATAAGVVDFPALAGGAAERKALVRTFWRVRSDIVIVGRAFHDEATAIRLRASAVLAEPAIDRLRDLSLGREVGLIDRPNAADDDTIPLSGGVTYVAACFGLSQLDRDCGDLANRFRDLQLLE